MNRRELIVLSGAALAAQQGVATAQQIQSASSGAKHPAAKVLLKYSRAKTSYKVPKNDKKSAKYLNSLSAALSLTPNQQQSASAIFQNARAARKNLKQQIKAARSSLSGAVFANDANAISQASATLASLKAQRMSIGANAQAAFYQLLSADQRAKLLQYKA